MHFWSSAQSIRIAGITFLPFVVWGLLQILLYHKFGVQVPNDAKFRYIPYAQNIAQHFYYDMGQDIRYAGYTTILAAFFKINLPFSYIVGFQILLSGLALFLVQRITLVLTNNRVCAFVVALLVASCQDIHQWNFYILTESIFTSAFIFCFATLVLVKKRMYLLLSIPLWLFTCTIRPNGFIIVAAAAVYFISSYYRQATLRQRRALLLLTSITGIALLGIINKLLGPFTLVETYARGEVIYGTYYSDLTPPGSSFFYRLTPPTTLEMPPANSSALQKLFLFFWHNPLFSLKLALAKGFTFLAFAKPHFSKVHNLIIFFTVYPCYYLAFKAWRQNFNSPIILSLFTIISLQTIMVMFTVEDWDCRFTAPILPFIFILSGLGIKCLWGTKLPIQDKVNTK